ncbi:ArsR/SmtB family transcription factor [Brachybacterium tyrofermentans]|uniref:ArsR/SmtB family transcription factor n=1 Tax=Brachybacterium tyrofermentans TaxID=47848 RepID=UPI003FCF23F5
MNSSSSVQVDGSTAISAAARLAEHLEEVRGRIPGESAMVDLADVFSLLGDPSRLGLLIALLEEELCVSDLAQVTEHSESSVSHALKLLRAHRIVAVRRAGRRAFYRLDDPHVRLLLELAISHAAHSDMHHPEREPGEQRDGGSS